MAHLVTELLALRLGRLIDALAVYIEQPTVIEAAKPAILDTAVRQVGSAMRPRRS